jgi:hypothetical protein
MFVHGAVDNQVVLVRTSVICKHEKGARSGSLFAYRRWSSSAPAPIWVCCAGCRPAVNSKWGGPPVCEGHTRGCDLGGAMMFKSAYGVDTTTLDADGVVLVGAKPERTAVGRLVD